MNNNYYVYIVTNNYNKVLYTGVTNNIERRIYEHKSGIGGTFTSQYNAGKLVYYEMHGSMEQAIIREKYIKGKKRKFKLKLIKNMNPKWDDLWEKNL